MRIFVKEKPNQYTEKVMNGIANQDSTLLRLTANSLKEHAIEEQNEQITQNIDGVGI